MNSASMNSAGMNSASMNSASMNGAGITSAFAHRHQLHPLAAARHRPLTHQPHSRAVCLPLSNAGFDRRPVFGREAPREMSGGHGHAVVQTHDPGHVFGDPLS